MDAPSTSAACVPNQTSGSPSECDKLRPLEGCMRSVPRLVVGALCLVAPLVLHAQQAAQAPQVVSPDVSSDRRVTFRILAPNAQKVELRTPGDIPGIGGRGGTPLQFAKNADGVWEA